ncbi:MAG TPA: DUF6155 family protein, partial [Paludibacter sp.]|nr:DUF6155 family protein [Paludibacter sp.]
LIEQVLELDKNYTSVQEYYKLFLSGDEEAVLKKQKKIIENEFFPGKGLPRTRYSVARKAISDIAKLGISPEYQADLMLFYVEIGVRFTLEYGDINEQFYNSMESMFFKALKYMHKERLLSLFQFRAKEILEATSDVGWGFHDTLGDYYFEYYRE